MDINRVVLCGGLTRDPELKTYGETKVCTLRVASSSRVKEHGEWTEKSNYVDVVVFGRQAETCDQYLAKGRRVMVDGRLDFREWEQDGNKRSVLRVYADSVQFVDGGGGGGERSRQSSSAQQAPPVTAAPAEDDIPF